MEPDGETTIRVRVTLPRTLVEEIDRLVGRGQRSAFLVEAFAAKLERERQSRVLNSTVGILAAEDYPEWATPEDVSAWVRKQRAAGHARPESVGRFWTAGPCEAQVYTGVGRDNQYRACRGNGVRPATAFPVDSNGVTSHSVTVFLCGSHRYQLESMSALDYPRCGSAIRHPEYGDVVGVA